MTGSWNIGASDSLGLTVRHALRDSTARTLNQQLDVERDTQSAMGKTADFIEGVMAFREKRPPHFKGC